MRYVFCFFSIILAIIFGSNVTVQSNDFYHKSEVILPFYRIVAFYGSFFHKKMGILGAYPPAEMIKKLKKSVIEWEIADATFPVKPALHHICLMAQNQPGNEGLYIKRVSTAVTKQVIQLADTVDALVFLDLQVGFSTLQEELPKILSYLQLPKVHLGIDPEFSMKGMYRVCPGKKIGYFDAEDINFVIDFLSKIVREHNLPPKILVIHCFTENMVRNYKKIKLTKEVQLVMNMDGHGSMNGKVRAYKICITDRPVQFTGFKIFYKNDKKKYPHRLMTPKQILALRPKPLYIQYH